jgi:hypothetical protein
MIKVIRSEVKDTELELSDHSTVTIDGELGLGIRPRNYSLINGNARFKVMKGRDLFRVVTRPGTIEVTGTDFEVDIQEKPASETEGAGPGDNESVLTVKVNSGNVKVHPYGRRKAIVIDSGGDAAFTLKEVRRGGAIQAIGFGIDYREGKIGERMKQRAAKIMASRSLAEFAAGMKFSARFNNDALAFDEANFATEASVPPNAVYEYQQLDEEIMLCVSKAEIKIKDPVRRRNCRKISSRAEAEISGHKNTAMAILSARTEAILSIVKQAGRDVYGSAVPGKLTGTFYPETFEVGKEGKYAVATVSGEVLFE